ncbi:MBL fold metallo-hydrolase [Muricauda sp. MAR_2010_75]|jgi:glyoxylase-like metal-dependent hydrolase (beta-lactamase superfamily II)|uniref:MBL fold metallo-hydrolase n=1 Tax=Allomuricauda sp. MAR_2010_75 TaxID=1250232 RepID=UPI00055C6D57|nr:MBL fold metallo-hydrolase [Muricauda sp. MAR_2010_75]
MRYFLSFLLFFPLLALHAQDEEVIITIDTLSQKTFMLTGNGGNIGIYLGPEQVFMVDDQFAPLSEKIKAAIATLTDKPISYLLNTHMHGDHTGGNVNFNTDETVLVAQNNVRKRLKIGGEEKLKANEITAQEYENTLPEITFSEGLTFHDGDETVMAFHVHNAHTDGDAMIYFVNENVLHMGDTYFAGRYPYIDLGSGGSIDGYIAAHKKALLVIDAETKIIPGHGRPSSKAELETYVQVLEDIKDIIQKEITAGKSLEEVKNNGNLTSKYDSVYGNGHINPERMRETVYKSLTGSK